MEPRASPRDGPTSDLHGEGRGTCPQQDRAGTPIDSHNVASGLIDAVHSELGALTTRERDVLERIAEGQSNRAIAEQLAITVSGAEKHVSSIFTKLELADTRRQDRRVLATLAFLRGSG